MHKDKLMDIHVSKVELKIKFEKVLDLWATIKDSKWEDVITAVDEVGLTALAAQLHQRLNGPEQSPGQSWTGQESSSQGDPP